MFILIRLYGSFVNVCENEKKNRDNNIRFTLSISIPLLQVFKQENYAVRDNIDSECYYMKMAYTVC